MANFNLKNPFRIELEPNLLGKDYVVGDLHGCYDEMIKLLSFVSFNKSKDRLFCVGDLIHRGPLSEKCLSFLGSKSKGGRKWFYSTLGNHDDYSNQHIFNNSNIDIEKYQEEIYKLPYIYVVNHEVFGKFYVVHSEISYDDIFGSNSEISDSDKVIKRMDNDLSNEIHDVLSDSSFKLSDEERHKLLWSRDMFKYFTNKNKLDITIGDFNFLEKNKSLLDKIKIFCGHNVVPFPMQIGHQIYCDTGACFGYDLPNEKIKIFSKWGNEFFSLSLIDINMGKVYSCVTSESSIDYDYERGDVVTMQNYLYQNIFEYNL